MDDSNSSSPQAESCSPKMPVSEVTHQHMDTESEIVLQHPDDAAKERTLELTEKLTAGDLSPEEITSNPSSPQEDSILPPSISSPTTPVEEKEDLVQMPPPHVHFDSENDVYFEDNDSHSNIVFRSAPQITSLSFSSSLGPYHGTHGNFVLELFYANISWKVEFHRQNLLELHSSLKSIQLKKRLGMMSCFGWKSKPAATDEKDHQMADSLRDFSNTVDQSATMGNNNTPHMAALKRLHFPRSLLYVQNVVNESKQQKIQEEVFAYIQLILQDMWIRNLPASLEFFRVSCLTFDPTTGPSVIEGWARVQMHLNSRSTLLNWHSCRWGCLICNCACLPLTYSKRVRFWVVVKSSFVAFLSKPLDCAPLSVLLFDSIACELRKGFSTTGRKKSFFLFSSAFVGDFKLASRLEMKMWARVLSNHLNTPDEKAYHSRDHPFSSFAPVRSNCFVQYLIDGKAYFDAVLHALSRAKKQIFLSGWWITPDVEMDRSLHIRLSDVLFQRAEAGVEIYIFMFGELNFALSLNSKFQESRLANTRNIYIQRHPVFRLINLTYWSHHEKLVVCDGVTAFVGGLDLCWGRWDEPSHRLVNDGTSWPGVDFYNPRIRDIQDPKQFTKSLLTDNEVRMPWHDVSCEVYGPIAADLARHFIHQWNFSIESKTGSNYTTLPRLLPCDFPVFSTEPLSKRFFKLNCQALRSLPRWSGGGSPTEGIDDEMSIQNAYIQVISDAQRYIYIENQFFVSGMANDLQISNRIVQALYARIVRAASEKQRFRVIVFLPLLPAFEGDFTGTSLRQILYWQYRTICRAENRKSLWEMLEDTVENPEEYLTFFSLRTFQVNTSASTTEMVYIHSKIMLVDDHISFIGSANINDRSMKGNRDSELCLFSKDVEFESESQLFGEPWPQTGRFTKSLRMELLHEHFGYADYYDDFLENFHLLERRARRNTLAFEAVFHCIPSNEIRTFTDLKVASTREDEPSKQQEQEEEDSDDDEEIRMRRGLFRRMKSFNSLEALNAQAQTRLMEVKGHVVLFPMDFLKEVKKLKPTGVLEDEIFT